MAEYVFREFRKRLRTEKGSGPAVKILRGGAISLNSKALELLGTPSYVVLLQDEVGRAFALRAADPNEPNAYPVRAQKNTATRLVSGRAFLNAIGADHSGPVRVFTPRKIGSLLVVDLTGDSAPHVVEDAEVPAV